MFFNFAANFDSILNFILVDFKVFYIIIFWTFYLK